MTRYRILLAATTGSLLAGAVLTSVGHAAGDAVVVPPPSSTTRPASGTRETIVFAGGCFWGVQSVFQHVKGVTSAQSGYTGGTTTSPTYEDVSGGTTGHAESVRVVYDPRVVSTEQLLQVFFSVVADPTELNFQGPDEGTQYRSDIFASTADQATTATAYIKQLDQAHVFRKPIVTRVDMLGPFTPAEGYHQDYALRHPHHPYIVVNDAPKVENLKRLFPALYREKPEGLAASL